MSCSFRLTWNHEYLIQSYANMIMDTLSYRRSKANEWLPTDVAVEQRDRVKCRLRNASKRFPYSRGWSSLTGVTMAALLPACAQCAYGWWTLIFDSGNVCRVVSLAAGRWGWVGRNVTQSVCSRARAFTVESVAPRVIVACWTLSLPGSRYPLLWQIIGWDTVAVSLDSRWTTLR